ncbi:MAG: TRAP transporter substrate-binding protein [Prevotella sp.]|jgi:tripartite ATP-independent transporter DctP family solute receptor|nr:TRAP transporter substrate-binding protein [Prevotella sp.]
MKPYDKALSIILLLTGLFCSCSSSKKDYLELKLAYVMSTGGASHEGALKFAELVKERSGGKVQVKIYPNAQLGSDRELIEGLELRAVDMIIVGPSLIGWYAPEYGVMEVPFLFRDYEHLDKVLYGEIGKEIETSIASKRKLHFLAYFRRGPRYLTTTNKPVSTPAELKGLKLRVPELPVYIEAWKMFGANPTPITYSDMFMALKQGIVDGQENPLETIFTSHLYETQKYAMDTKHLLSYYIVAVGDNFYKKFDPDTQALLTTAIKEAADYQNGLMDQFEEKYKQILTEHRVEIIPVDRNAFEDIALNDIAKALEKRLAPDIIQRISNVK